MQVRTFVRHVRVRTLVSDHLSLALLPTSGSTRHSPPAVNIYSQRTDDPSLPPSPIPEGYSPSTLGTSILSVAHHNVSFLHASFEQDVLRGQGGPRPYVSALSVSEGD